MQVQFKSLKDLEEYLSDTDMLDLEELTEALLREPAEEGGEMEYE